MSDLNALADRVEKLTGPDRGADCLIWLAVGDELGEDPPWEAPSSVPRKPLVCVNGRWMGSALEKFSTDINGIARSWGVPRFSESLDAAMTLVPEGTNGDGTLCNIETWDRSGVHASHIRATAWVAGERSYAATPALALTAAALRARAGADR